MFDWRYLEHKGRVEDARELSIRSCSRTASKDPSPSRYISPSNWNRIQPALRSNYRVWLIAFISGRRWWIRPRRWIRSICDDFTHSPFQINILVWNISKIPTATPYLKNVFLTIVNLSLTAIYFKRIDNRIIASKLSTKTIHTKRIFQSPRPTIPSIQTALLT